MGGFTPAYRMRVYAGRSVDAAEATVLTPAAGAPHSDAFQVSTLPVLTGYKPYLNAPKGRRGQIDPQTSKLDVGSLSVALLDRRVADDTGNAVRWVTAFLGDVKGVARLLGLRVEIDESVNGGTSWARFWTGRIQGASLASRLSFELTIEDGLADMTTDVFVGLPHPSITYASPTQLLPVGMPLAFGPLTRPHLHGIVHKSNTGRAAYLLPEQTTADIPANVITKPLEGARGDGHPGSYIVGQFQHMMDRVAVELTETAAPYATGWYSLEGMGHGLAFNPDGQQRAGELFISALLGSDPRFLAVPTEGTAVKFWVLWNAPPAAETPFYIVDVDPVQLWMDLLDGYFGYFWEEGASSKPAAADVGDPVRAFAYDATAMGLLLGTRPQQRYVVTKDWKLNDFIEQCICRPLALAYYVNASGQVVPVDLKTPTSVAGLGTLGSADVCPTPAPQWEHDRATALVRVAATYYTDRQVSIAEMIAGGEMYPAASPSVLVSAENKIVIPDFGRMDLGDRETEVKAEGFRAFESETMNTQGRGLYLQNEIQRHVGHLRRPFGAGAMFATLACRRTATVTALQPGSLVLVAVPELPDPWTNQRGGTRVMRVVSRSEDGILISLRLLDLGFNGQANVPTVSAFAQRADSPHHAVNVTVALNAQSDPVALHYAVTETSVGTSPTVDDLAWTFGRREAAAGTYPVAGLPSGKRVWVRVRSEPTSMESAALPSAWVTKAGTAYVDTDQLTAPTSGSATPTSTAATLHWTVGEALCPVLVARSGADTVTLPAGSTQYFMAGLTASTGYTAHVTHVDGQGGVSAALDIAFTTAAPGNDATLPALRSLRITSGTY